jgi:ferredoxin
MSPYLSWRERWQLPMVLRRKPNGELVVRHAQMGRVAIDEAACTGCRLCVRACPAASLEMSERKKARMIGEDAGCIACSDCVAVCAPNAVRVARPMTYDGLYKHIGRGELAYPRQF